MSLSFSFSGINMILSIDISDKRLKVTPNGPYHIHGVTGFITVDSADNLPEVPIFGVIYQDLSTCDMFIPQCDGYRKLVADQIAMNGIFKTTTSENGRLMVSQILSRKYVGGNIAPPTYCDFSVESLEKLYTSDAATKHLIIVDGELRIWQNDHNYGLVLMNKLKLDKFVKGSSSKASSLGFSPTIVVNPEDLGFSKQSFSLDAGFTTSEPNSQSLTPNHQEGNNMPSIQGVNINFNLLEAVAETPKDDLSTFTADVDNGELAAAIRESLAADRKAKLASAAQEFVKVFRAAELTTAAAVEGIRAARRAEEQHRKTLNTIKRAQQYAIETNNALPLVCAMVNTTEHVVPAAWKPKNAKK